MKTKLLTAGIALLLGTALPLSAVAQVPSSITTPDRVESSIGTLGIQGRRSEQRDRGQGL